MPIYRLTPQLVFPPVEHAEDGVLAVGGDLRPERLLLAYSQGIFPWYHEGLPIIWHSPDPRAVLYTHRLRVNRSLRKVLKKQPYAVTVDQAFSLVIQACKDASRPGQDGTWITPEMEGAYNKLHQLGFAHSVETWDGDTLVGGLYGVSLGQMFFGESMFSHAPNASKVASVGLVACLRATGHTVIDCQVANEHTVALGAEDIPRRQYTAMVNTLVALPPLPDTWKVQRFFPDPPAGDDGQA